MAKEATSEWVAVVLLSSVCVEAPRPAAEGFGRCHDTDAVPCRGRVWGGRGGGWSAAWKQGRRVDRFLPQGHFFATMTNGVADNSQMGGSGLRGE